MLGICRGNGKENGNYYLGFTGDMYEEYGGYVRRLVGPRVYRGHWHISVSLCSLSWRRRVSALGFEFNFREVGVGFHQSQGLWGRGCRRCNAESLF